MGGKQGGTAGKPLVPEGGEGYFYSFFWLKLKRIYGY
jgi:hypothetical protein